MAVTPSLGEAQVTEVLRLVEFHLRGEVANQVLDEKREAIIINFDRYTGDVLVWHGKKRLIDREGNVEWLT